jgi:hypothetical protein
MGTTGAATKTQVALESCRYYHRPAAAAAAAATFQINVKITIDNRLVWWNSSTLVEVIVRQ